MSKKKEWKRMCVCVLPEEHRKIRVGAAELGVSVSIYIRTLIKAHLVEMKLMEDPTAKLS